VTPTAAGQTLDTQDHLMRNDLTIAQIPTYEVSNQYGTTINIGG